MSEGPHDSWELDDAECTIAEDDPGNRRTQPRAEVTLQVGYQSLDELLVAYTTDISHGGLFLETTNFLATGSVVKLELQLPDEGPTMAIIARIAYVIDDDTRRGMGVEFLDAGGIPVAEQLGSYLALSLGETAQPDREPPATILVVDDDGAYRDKAAMVMRKRGHRVITARNGLEALGQVLRDPPDLVLSDVNMPTMDGWQFLRILRARPSVAHVPVMFLTTLSSEDERLKGYRLGVDDYIAKPFLYEELALRVARVLVRAKNASAHPAARNALRGDLSQVTLQSVLQFVDIERRTGLLLVVSGKRFATLHVREGSVVAVDLGEGPTAKDGMERLFEVLDWTEGRFELTTAEVSIEDSVDRSTAFLLLEHARRRDERGD